MHDTPPTAIVPTASRWLPLKVSWLIPLGLGGYFVCTRAFPFLVVTEDSYGAYFWSRAWMVLPHVVFGIVAITLGALQFSSRIRTRHAMVHRVCGWTYLISVALGAVAALGLAATSRVGLVYAVGLGTLATAWIGASYMGLAAIRRRNLAQHRHWMTRSYVLTFAFPVFRLIEEGLGALVVGSRIEQLTLAAWCCWTIPLFVTEIVLQSRETFRVQAEPGR